MPAIKACLFDLDGVLIDTALYPMVTMNGEECHNEWEITFEEIHRNGAIAFAIYNYIRYTGDATYLAPHGLAVLLANARFWAQRVNWSQAQQKFVMLGVTGPNEYENNVNNNWYTSLMARWCLEYALEALGQVKYSDPEQYALILEETGFRELEEPAQWQHILSHNQSDIDLTVDLYDRPCHIPGQGRVLVAPQHHLSTSN